MPREGGRPSVTDVLERPRERQRAKVAAYVALTKPRIIELLLVTTVPAMVVAEKGLPSGWLILATLIGGTLSAGGANAVNMYVDRDIDQIMERTQGRPIVTGEVSPRAALTFAIALEAVAFAWLWGLVNLLSAVLALAACLFYVFVYTLWLKRRSVQNIVIGGAAGAAPVLIGWAAVANEITLAGVVLFGVVFLWTPPHFWALALRYRDDYAAASVPMLPVVVSISETGVRIVRYSVALWALTAVFGVVAGMGLVYHVTAAALGASFTVLSVRLWRSGTTEGAMRLFSFSITYLTLLFAVIVLDELLRSGW
ncbi:MAG: protoheme IX farnesyltransferase [Actinobacteria bacterium]|nr:protoheme IX farnesyltransferase [Actinomycetota bacterium]